MSYDTNIQTDGYECSECKELGERLRAKVETALSVEATIAGLNTNLSRAVEEVLELRAENKKLKEDVELLDALQAAGVDNWEGYGIALATM